MKQNGVIILVHGSRGERGSAEIYQVLRRLTEGVKASLASGVEVIGASLQFNHPNLEEAVEYLVSKGADKLVIAPYFLFAGRHITEHIPHLIKKFNGIYPKVQFVLSNVPGADELLVDQIVRRIQESASEFLPEAWFLSTLPDDIEKQSMTIVEILLPDCSELTREEKAVVMRIVHASGDSQIASLIRFHPSAVSAGVAAIGKGKPIFTDVRMVASGINQYLAQKFGSSIHCALDEMVAIRQAQAGNITRSACAIKCLGKELDGAIVAIGNAPTALNTLLELIDSGEINPALTIGMPVGFVQAKESKEKLMRVNSPYITVEGTRGGSAMAVATVNALLKIAAEKNGSNKFTQ
ncbi:MAG: precorrin-8X methylmutase [Actinobacteria bacterium]|nr:precorrin-8X methylmutase [Actinomycetota bacterium]